jgi:2,3-bisphosphoglycerate-dependent phosphoglycerate mutase
MAARTDYDLVIVRHGESEANKLNIFTGWRDSKLSPKGVEEARAGGKLLRDGGYRFDLAFTSLQSRAIKTLWLALEEMDQMWIPVRKHWRLNERHYGALQGKDKVQSVKEFGEAQVMQWRRSFSTPPPLVDDDSPEHPRFDLRYRDVPPAELPRGESLKDVIARVMPYWEGEVIPEIKRGKKVIIAAHGNSLRALLKHLEGLSEEEIKEVNLPTGIPKVYKLSAKMLAESAQFLGDPEELNRRIQAVANQTKRS